MTRIGSKGVLVTVASAWMLVVSAYSTPPASGSRYELFVVAFAIGVATVLFTAAQPMSAVQRALLMAFGVAAIVGGLSQFDALVAGLDGSITRLMVDPYTRDGVRIAAVVALASAAAALLSVTLARVLRLRVALVILPGVAIIGLFVVSPVASDTVPAFALTAASWPIGRRLLRTIVDDVVVASWATVSMSVALGLLTISLCWLVLGVAHLFMPIAIVAVVLALLAFSWVDARQCVRQVLSLRLKIADRLELAGAANMWMLVCLATGLGLLHVIAALGPDIANDSVNHHLAIAAQFAAQGSLDPLPETQVSYWQIPIQVLYAGLTSVTGVAGAKVLHVAFEILVALAVASTAVHVTRQVRVGLLAVVLFLAPNIGLYLASTAYLEFGETFFLVMTVVGLMRWVETHDRGWLLAAGLCAGMGAAARLTSGVVAPAGALVIVLVRRTQWKSAVADILAFGGASLLTWLPWVVRSSILTGNPLFPWMNEIFRSDLVESVNVFAGVQFGFGSDVWSLLRVPFTATFQPERFVEAGEVGRFWLALAPLLLLALARRWRGPMFVPALVLVFYAAAWFSVFLQNLRYFVPALPLCAVLLAVAIGEIRSGWRRTWIESLAIGVVVVSIIVGTQGPTEGWLTSISGQGFPFRLVLGQETRSEFIGRYITGAKALDYLNARYGRAAKIWAPEFAGVRLYSDGTIVFSDGFTTLPLRRGLSGVTLATDSQEVSSRLKALGFTHMLIDQNAPDFSLPDEKRPSYFRSDFFDRFTSVEFADGGIVVRRLLDQPNQQNDESSALELLQNSRFDVIGQAPPKYWYIEGHVTWDSSTAGIAFDESGRLFSDPFPVTPAHLYRLRVWAKTAGTPLGGLFELDFLDAAGRSIPRPWQAFYADSERRPFEVIGIAPANAVAARVLIGGLESGGLITVEQASVTDLSPR